MFAPAQASERVCSELFPIKQGGQAPPLEVFFSIFGEPHTQAGQTRFRVLVLTWISELERSKFKRDESHPVLANVGFQTFLLDLSFF